MDILSDFSIYKTYYNVGIPRYILGDIYGNIVTSDAQDLLQTKWKIKLGICNDEYSIVISLF